jgi:hypothetical protein
MSNLKSMKAAIVGKFGQPLMVREVTIPTPGPGQALVQVVARGVCHTDLPAVDGDWPIRVTKRTHKDFWRSVVRVRTRGCNRETPADWLSTPYTFMNTRFGGCIWPSCITRQDSRNWYLIFASVETKEGFLHFISGGSAGISAGGRSQGHEHFYHSISEAQFKWIETGATLASSNFVLIKNLWPSPLTS